MTARYLETMFTPEIRAAQEAGGSRSAYARKAEEAAGPDPLGLPERAFISARDSFYLASVTATGWPYVQHRGGPRGFVRIVDERTLAFADYRGNRQYITLGNVKTDDRVALFFMDYPNRTRLKLLGHMREIDLGAEPAIADALADPTYKARAERGFLIRVEAFDWNCSQHIQPRFSPAELEPLLASLQARIAELELALEGRAS